jgi:hypothetical protein
MEENWPMCVRCKIIFFTEVNENCPFCHKSDEKIMVTAEDVEFMHRVINLWDLNDRLSFSALTKSWEFIPESIHHCFGGSKKLSLEK